jgi:hypothetical protein
MMPAQAIRASTQDHLEIEDIKEGIVILKDGGACLVNFPIQIVIRTQQKDISNYLNLLNQTAEEETHPLIKEQIIKYTKFVAETVKKNNVLDKKFYIVVPMSSLEVGAAKAFVATFNPAKRMFHFDKAYILQKAKINLYPKRDHILRLLGRLGIKGKQLETKELIKLFFEIYNPESPGQQIIEGEQYQKPLVSSTLPRSAFSQGQVFEKINDLIKGANK